MTGCGTGTVVSGPAIPTSPSVNAVVPSPLGIPNSVTALWPYEYVSVQGTGQIFIYNISSGTQVAAGVYATPCQAPSGMLITNIGGKNVMAAVCYDTGSLMTLAVNTDGSLSIMGSVNGLVAPFPGIALDGTNVLVPLYGVGGSNGGVAKISIAAPSSPAVIAIAMLASSVPGGISNAGFLAVDGGNIFVASGSESYPQTVTSTIQVVNETTMTLVGSPLVVAHSPQHIAVVGNTAYATFYDAAQLESIDVSNPASLKMLQVYPLTVGTSACNAIGLSVTGGTAFVGCYGENAVEKFNVNNPANMIPTLTLQNVNGPQGFFFVNQYLLVTDGVTGGYVYEINPGSGISGTV